MFRTMLATRNEPAPLMARVVLGVVMFPHGAQHALGWFGGYGFRGTLTWMTETLGFPVVLAAMAIVVELVAPFALVLGLGGRVAGLGIAGLMAGAALTHAGNGFFMNWFGTLAPGAEGYEYHVLAGTLAAVIVMTGSGMWSLDRRITAAAGRRGGAAGEGADAGGRVRRARVSSVAAVALLTGVLLAGCADDGTRPGEPVQSVEVTPEAVTITVGGTTALAVKVRGSGGRELPHRHVSWSSDRPEIASVTAVGLVTGHGPGTVRVTANSEGREDAAAVTVSVGRDYDLVHSSWPGFPMGEWRLYTVRLGEVRSEPLLPADVLPGYGLTQAAVSPDGRRIAFMAYSLVEGFRCIYSVNVDGSGLRRLTSGGNETQPAWSPDGSRIAYVFRPYGQQADIWVMDADGSNPVNLTGSANGAHQYSPAWSRDSAGGSRIAFGEGDVGHSSIWTMRPDGTDRRRITTGTEWWDDDPSWSPDGTRIAFRREGPGTRSSDIWIVDATSANPQPLVQLPGGQGLPEYSPDGRLIAFTSAHADDPVDSFVIYTVSSDGSDLTRRTFDPAVSTRPAWRVRQ